VRGLVLDCHHNLADLNSVSNVQSGFMHAHAIDPHLTRLFGGDHGKRTVMQKHSEVNGKDAASVQNDVR